MATLTILGDFCTMRYLRSLFCVLLLTSLAGAQAEPSPPEPAQSATTPSNTTQPSEHRPAVDEANVNGGVFQSAYFKFTYELPKDWKALDDASRVAANKQFQEQETASSSAAVPSRKRPLTSQPAASKPVVVSAAPMENYSLLVASPSGVASLDSIVLPRINIWAKRRIPPLDHIDDPAQFLTGGRYANTIVKPQHLTFDGHDFVRADIVTSTGVYRTQFVTIIGDYLIGFEFHADSEKERALGADSMKTVKFH